jgi:hypothetical protein
MKESEDKVVLVPESQYIDELEEQVRYFVNTTPDLPKNNIKYTRDEIPEFKNEHQQEEWEHKHILRCVNGYKGMVGKMYFFYHFCKIRNLGGGKISPEFRVCDNEWFKIIEEAEKSREYGVVCVKRRRVGASWKEAADVLHDCLFKPFYSVGMNSKSEKDSIELFRKVKFLYSNLPAFLRVKTTAGNTKMYLDFSYFTKDDNGNKIKKGNESSIIVVAPTDSAYEGMMLNKWIADEAGKTPNLPQIWSFTEDCLMQETQRVGIPIIFGTSGDIGADGKGLKEMWYNSEVYRLKRFFFAGWNGLLVDEFGNDLKEETIRWIIYERHRRRNLNPKSYNDFIQKYPLTVNEAFSQASVGGVGDIIKINKQKLSLADDPVKKVRGRFRLNSSGQVEFEPTIQGKCIVYSHPEPHKKNYYIAGCDPADHDDAYDEASDLSLYILKKHDGLEPPRIVFEYTDRPQKLNDYYEQATMALMYYNNCKVLIERNRYRMISFFEDRGQKHLLQTTPQGIVRLIGGKASTIGINMNDSTKEYMEGLISEYVDDYCEFIPSEELLQEFVDYGAKNTDKAMAFGVALILLKEDKSQIKQKNQMLKTTPRFGYRRVGGKIVRYQDKNQFVTPMQKGTIIVNK